MNIKGNIKVEGQATIDQLPITADSLSAVVELNGSLGKRELGTISTFSKEGYIPGLSLSFPSIFKLNTTSLDYNNRSMIVSLNSQLQGTSFMAPVVGNGTPAFRRIVKSDLTDASVVFTDDSTFVKKSGDTMTGQLIGRKLGSSWINGMGASAGIRFLPPSSSLTYSSWVTQKTYNGAGWSIGNLGDNFYISFATKENMETSSNIVQQQLSIIPDGTITSFKDGNSTQWKQAYDRGDFRTYGLGDPLSSFGNWDLSSRYSGFVNYINDSSPITSIGGRIFGFKTIYGTSFGAALAMRNKRISFKTLEAGVESNWIELWSKDSLTKLSQLENDLNLKNNYHNIVKTISDVPDTPYYGVIGGLETNDMLGNGSAYLSSGTVGGVSRTNSHVVSYGVNASYGFQFIKSASGVAPLSVRLRVNGVWSEEEFAYRSWINAQGFLPNKKAVNGSSIDSLGIGHFYSDLSTTLIDKPFNNVGSMLSLGSNGGQLVFERFTNTTTSANRIAFRQVMSSGLKSNWVELYHTGNLTKLSQLENDIDFDSRYLKLGGNIKFTDKSISSDLNLQRDSVVFAQSSATNKPFNTNSTIVTFSGLGDYGFQLGGRSSNFSYRPLEGGVWGEWKLIATEDWVNSRGFVTTDTTYSNFTKTVSGLVPAPTGTTSTRYLREDGTWVVPTNTTYSAGTKAIIDLGTSATNQVWSAKVLSDFVKENVVNKQIFELTTQGGLKVKDWISVVGFSSIAIGQNASAEMSNSLALMTGALSNGNNSISIGAMSQAIGPNSIALGSYSTSRNGAFSLGYGILNTQEFCTTVGAFNIDLPSNKPIGTLSEDDETPVHIIGSGTSDGLRANAQVTYRDGSTRYFGRQYYDEGIRPVIDFSQPNTLIDVQYLRDNGNGLTSDPFTLTGNQFSGDTIDNPIFTGTTPNNHDLVYMYFEAQGNNVWSKYNGLTAALAMTALVGVYLKPLNKILLRGYFVKSSFNPSGNLAWVYNLSTGADSFTNTLPTSYRILGNVVSVPNKVVFFNPR